MSDLSRVGLELPDLQAALGRCPSGRSAWLWVVREPQHVQGPRQRPGGPAQHPVVTRRQEMGQRPLGALWELGRLSAVRKPVSRQWTWPLSSLPGSGRLRTIRITPSSCQAGSPDRDSEMRGKTGGSAPPPWVPEAKNKAGQTEFR